MPSIEKKLMLKELKVKLKDKNVFFTQHRKVRVTDFGRLRQSLTKSDGASVVVKNSVARLALKDLGIETALPAIDGAVFLVTATNEPQIISKLLVDFAKEQEEFKISGVFIDGEFRPATYVKELAKLPSRERLLASVVGGMMAPVSNFVFVLNSMVRSLVVVLNEVSKKKSST